MQKRRNVCLAGLMMLANLLVACATPVPAAPPTPAVQEISLIALDIYWDRDVIEAQANQPLRLTLRNDGALDHNFEILELGISVLLPPGETEVIEFVVDRNGVFSYLCSIPGHDEAGMLGELVISDQ